MRLLLTAYPQLPMPPKLYGGIERIVNRLVTRLEYGGIFYSCLPKVMSDQQCPSYRTTRRSRLYSSYSGVD